MSYDDAGEMAFKWFCGVLVAAVLVCLGGAINANIDFNLNGAHESSYSEGYNKAKAEQAQAVWGSYQSGLTAASTSYSQQMQGIANDINQKLYAEYDRRYKLLVEEFNAKIQNDNNTIVQENSAIRKMQEILNTRNFPTCPTK